ncbi:hypothetical protein J1614_008324 [Plenodomus biglobosus]|nr:hypothetical protein J1614_008324 [Plenodomus biglobosus]
MNLGTLPGRASGREISTVDWLEDLNVLPEDVQKLQRNIPPVREPDTIVRGHACVLVVASQPEAISHPPKHVFASVMRHVGGVILKRDLA